MFAILFAPVDTPVLRGPSVFPRVDFLPAALIHVPVLFFQRSPSIAASGERAECGARQLASRWSAGRRRALRHWASAPEAATPGNRGPAVARGGPRIWVRQPAAIRRWRLPALQPLFLRGRKSGMRANPGPEMAKNRGGEALLRQENRKGGCSIRTETFQSDPVGSTPIR